MVDEQQVERAVLGPPSSTTKYAARLMVGLAIALGVVGGIMVSLPERFPSLKEQITPPGEDPLLAVKGDGVILFFGAFFLLLLATGVRARKSWARQLSFYVFPLFVVLCLIGLISIPGADGSSKAGPAAILFSVMAVDVAVLVMLTRPPTVADFEKIDVVDTTKARDKQKAFYEKERQKRAAKAAKKRG
jgi:hypothetical protein